MSDVVGALRRYRSILGRLPIKPWTLDEQREEAAAVDAALAGLAWRDKPTHDGLWWARCNHEGCLFCPVLVETLDEKIVVVIGQVDESTLIRFAPVAPPPEDQP